jgi:integrase
MFTAGRRDEVGEMEWREIEGDLWLLPGRRSKSGRDHEVPLSSPMLSLLAEMPRFGDHIFTIDGRRPWTPVSKFKASLDRRSGVTDWRFHDIRRTVRSRLAELRVPFEIAERVLGHSMTKIERTYNRHAYREEKAAALQLWADRLAVIVGEGREAPNILEFKPPST